MDEPRRAQHPARAAGVRPRPVGRDTPDRALAVSVDLTPRRRLPLPVVLGGMLVGGLCALLALNTASAALEVQNRAVTDQNSNSSDTEQQLLRDLAAKQAPAALAAAARSLGMVPNPNPAFLKINSNGSVSVLGSPTPASLPPAPAPSPTAKPKPSTSASPTSTPTGKPGTSRGRAVVTVTVTKPASPAISSHPSSSRRPSSAPSATTGGH